MFHHYTPDMSRCPTVSYYNTHCLLTLMFDMHKIGRGLGAARVGRYKQITFRRIHTPGCIQKFNIISIRQAPHQRTDLKQSITILNLSSQAPCTNTPSFCLLITHVAYSFNKFGHFNSMA